MNLNGKFILRCTVLTGIRYLKSFSQETLTASLQRAAVAGSYAAALVWKRYLPHSRRWEIHEVEVDRDGTVSYVDQEIQ